jgi:hypothetical protein
MFLHPEDVDERLGWPLGRAARLARRGRLPHVRLPDGSVRFEWPEVEALLCRVPAAAGEVQAPVLAPPADPALCLP